MRVLEIYGVLAFVLVTFVCVGRHGGVAVRVARLQRGLVAQDRARQGTLAISTPTPEPAKVAGSPERGDCGRACPRTARNCLCRRESLRIWLAANGYDQEIP